MKQMLKEMLNQVQHDKLLSPRTAFRVSMTSCYHPELLLGFARQRSGHPELVSG